MALSNGESSLSMASGRLNIVVTLRHNIHNTRSPDLVACGTESHGGPSARGLCLFGASGPNVMPSRSLSDIIIRSDGCGTGVWGFGMTDVKKDVSALGTSRLRGGKFSRAGEDRRIGGERKERVKQCQLQQRREKPWSRSQAVTTERTSTPNCAWRWHIATI